MTYAQGTMTSANASNDMHTILDGLLIGAGWTLVETLTPSGVFRNSVYKSSGASNLCGYDWYVVIAWEATGTESVSSIIQGSAYDTGTHILSGISNGPMANGGTGCSVSSVGSYSSGTQTFNASTKTPSTVPVTIPYYNAGASSTSNGTPGLQWLFPSSAFAYWASITLDHISVFTTISAGYHLDGIISSCILDAGWSADAQAFQPLLVTWQLGASELLYANGNLFGTNSFGATTYIAVGIGWSDVYGPSLPVLSGFYSDAVAWKPYLWAENYKGGSAAVGWDGSNAPGIVALMGQVPDFYMVHGGSIGDTVTIDGATYVLGPVGTNDDLTVAVLVE